MTNILAAIESIELGNNGWADIGPSADLAGHVRAAGYVVIRSTNLHGRPTFKGYTRAAQAALAAEHATNGAAGYAVSTYKPIVHRDNFDYEGAILERQEREHFA